jgi:hypothetical protein
MNLRRIALFALAITISLAQATQVGLTATAVEPTPPAKRVHHYVFFGGPRADQRSPVFPRHTGV